MNINLEGDLGSITQIDFEKYLKTNYGIGNTMPMALPIFDYTKHNYPYCISYTIDNQLYYLFTCVFYDSFSKYQTYYLINTKATIEDANAPTIYHIKSRYLKPISGIEKGIWTDWSTEDPYTYNFLLACGGVSSGVISPSSSGYGNIRADTSTYGECLEVYLPVNSHGYLSQFTHDDLNQYTHDQIYNDIKINKKG